MLLPTRRDNLARDFRFALRTLRKDPRFTLVAVLALTLGIAATTVVFSVFYNLLFDAVAARNADRLVVPVIQDAARPGEWAQLYASAADLQYLREHSQQFDGFVAYRSGRAMVSVDSRTFQFNNAQVTPDAFEFYGVPPLHGRTIAPDDGLPGAPKVFVMSYATWKSEFAADHSIVGKTFVIDGEPQTLVGVMPERFRAFGVYRDSFTPADLTAKAANTPRFDVIARVKPKANFAAASAEFEVLTKQLAAIHGDDGDYPKKFSARVVGAGDYLTGISSAGKVFNSKIELKTILWDLLAAAFVLLLIACSNVANLLLARSTVREKEIAVRTALGASRRQIVGQLLMESLLLAFCASACGATLAWAAMKLVDHALHQKGWAEKGAEAVIGLNLPVLLFAVSITLLTTVLCGLLPALRASRLNLQPQIVGSGHGPLGGLQHGKLRAGLVVGQIALSIVLLIGAGLMMRSLYELTHIDLGFDAKNLVVIGMAPARAVDQLPDKALLASPEGQARFQKVIQKIKEMPGVESVAVDNTIPGYGPGGGPDVTAADRGTVANVGLDECDENCVDTLRMRMLAGRWLSKDEVDTRQYATVLSQTLARNLFGDYNSIGKRIQVKDFGKWTTGLHAAFRMPATQMSPYQTFEVVGVVADRKNVGPQQPARPMAFIPPLITGDFILQVRTKVKPELIMHALQEQVWATDRAEVFWIFDPLESLLEHLTYATPEFGVMLSAPMALIALLLAMIGVFSVMAYTVSLQTREIGVRIALGAQQRHILRTVLIRAAVMMVLGIVGELAASLAMTRLLASQIWGISATDPWTFGMVGTLMIVAGLAACYLPARRATLVDPMVALRYE